MKSKNIVVGISIGDPNGVGCEVALKAFSDKRMFDFCTPVFFTSQKIIQTNRKALSIEFASRQIQNLSAIQKGAINVLEIGDMNFDITFGKPTKESGSYAIKSLQTATNALKNNSIDVLVTAPISKENIQSETFNFPGHTNFLEQELGGKSLMFMVSDIIKIGLLTDHVALKDVVSHLSPQLINQKLETINHTLKQDFGVMKPKIGVLSINPHAGDGGVIGTEDDTILKPCIKSAFDNGIMAFGPYPSDSFFGSNTYQKFDAVIATYHDQGLIPFKTLTFGEGVNYTAGLCKVRTSPDHGTAFDIAGQNRANPNSFRAAVHKAIEIFNNRKKYS